MVGNVVGNPNWKGKENPSLLEWGLSFGVCILYICVIGDVGTIGSCEVGALVLSSIK